MPPDPRPTTIRHIALLYRIYFLYIEPLAALSGTYLCLFDPTRFLRGTVPAPALLHSPLPLSPIAQMLLTNIGALYALFAVNEAIVLRLTRERSVWLCVMAAMLASDVGHLYAVWAVAPERIWDVGGWTGDELVNMGLWLEGRF